MLGWLATMPVFVADAFRRSPDHIRLLAGGTTPWGARALHAAERTLGYTEAGSNNLGPDLEKLRRGHRAGKPEAWCAAAVSYWIEDGWALLHGYRSWAHMPRAGREACPIRRSHGARQLWRRVAKAGRIIEAEHLQPGDLVLWDRGVPGRPKTAWQAHIGIMSSTDPMEYIAGNEGPYPATVARHRWRGSRFVGGARLPRVGP